MAFSDFFFKAQAITERAELSAAYIDDVKSTEGLASPWADSSHLETVTFADVFGLNPEALPLNRASAMQIASLAKGRNLICTSIARMPLKSIKNGAPLANQPTLLKQLDPSLTNFEVLSWTIDSMLFYGRAFWLITERNFDGSVKHIRLVPESQVETKDGVLVKAFGKSVSPSDYIRLAANNEGLLVYGAGAIREAQEIELAAREAGSSPVPSIVLKQKEGTSTPEEIKSMVAGWIANRRKKGGSVAYVNKAVDVEALGQHAENLLIEGRNQAALQVARVLGLPAWAVDASVQGTSLSYSNLSSRNREIIDALSSFVVAIEQEISRYLPNGTEVKFDTTEMLKADTADRYDAYKVAIDAGVLTVNEARAYENLEPLEESTDSNADDLATRGNYAGTLIRSGFDPAESMEAAGLNPVKHLGLLPVTLQPPAAGTDLENAVEPLEPLQDEPSESPVEPQSNPNEEPNE